MVTRDLTLSTSSMRARPCWSALSQSHSAPGSCRSVVSVPLAMVGPMASNIKMLWHRHALRSRFRLSGAHAVLQGLRSRARLTSTSAFQDKTVWVEPRVEVPGSETGPLRGATFAVKDLFDVAGQATGFGNPQWRDSHPVPDTTAPVVQASVQPRWRGGRSAPPALGTHPPLSAAVVPGVGCSPDGQGADGRVSILA